MKKLIQIFVWLLLLFGLSINTRAQRVNSNPVGANLSVQDAGTCSTNGSFIWQVLPTNAGTTTVNLAGTFSATLLVRESNNGGGTWTTAATLTTAATTTYATNGFTDICIDLTAYTSGTVNVSVSTGLQQVQSVVSTGGTGGSALAGVFNISTSCGAAANCLQWVDDDSTNNCGAATTAFMALVNAYAGPGKVQLTIGGSGSGKAYKLSTASCALSFSVPAAIHLFATLDCAQPSGNNCILFNGPPDSITLDGNGSMVGGANLTNACIEIGANTNDFLIDGLMFLNCGAGNATLGNCANFAILVDNPVPNGRVIHTTYLSTIAGTCAYSNPNGSVAGTNTVNFSDNLIGWPGNVGASTCGSIGIIDGGSYGQVHGNTIYGAGMSIRLQGIGHRIVSNELDSALCVAKTKNAIIHFGANGVATNVNAVTIADNIAQVSATHTLYLIAQANDSSSSTMQAWTVHDNINASTGGGLFDSVSYPCTTTTQQFGFCYEYGNTNFNNVIQSCGATNAGWQLNHKIGYCQTSTAGANVGSTALLTVPTSGSLTPIYLTCQILVTTQATTSGTVPQCVISYTDFFTSVALTLILTPVAAASDVGCTSTPAFAANPAVGYSCQGTVGPLFVKSNTTINYSTINYASVGGTSMVAQVAVSAFVD